jgi:hypothetical protein
MNLRAKPKGFGRVVSSREMRSRSIGWELSPRNVRRLQRGSQILRGFRKLLVDAPQQIFGRSSR